MKMAMKSPELWVEKVAVVEEVLVAAAVEEESSDNSRTNPKLWTMKFQSNSVKRKQSKMQRELGIFTTTNVIVLSELLLIALEPTSAP